MTDNSFIRHLTTNKMAMVNWDNSSNYIDTTGKSQFLNVLLQI